MHLMMMVIMRMMRIRMMMMMMMMLLLLIMKAHIAFISIITKIIGDHRICLGETLYSLKVLEYPGSGGSVPT